MDRGSVPDWIMAFATVAMAITALGALSSWREQLRGTTKHDAALELATAAKTLRYHFFEARSPFYDASERLESGNRIPMYLAIPKLRGPRKRCVAVPGPDLATQPHRALKQGLHIT